MKEGEESYSLIDKEDTADKEVANWPCRNLQRLQTLENAGNNRRQK